MSQNNTSPETHKSAPRRDRRNGGRPKIRLGLARARHRVGAFLAGAVAGRRRPACSSSSPCSSLPLSARLGTFALLVLFAGAPLRLGARGVVLAPPRHRRRPPPPRACQRPRHRPLTALSDHLASGGNDRPPPRSGSPTAPHGSGDARGCASAGRKPVLRAIDPYGMRAALASSSSSRRISAGEQWSNRLRTRRDAGIGSGPAVPPEPRHLADTAGIHRPAAAIPATRPSKRHVAVPIGSAVLAQVHGGPFRRFSSLTPLATDSPASIRRISRSQAKMTEGHKLTSSRMAAPSPPGRSAHPRRAAEGRARDAAQPTQRGALRIEYHATDDYGVESVKAIITRSGGSPNEKIEIDLPLPAPHAKDAKAASFHDLTPHIWAGLPVRAEARRDRRARSGRREPPLAMTLPERVFHNPVARAVIEQRKLLTTDPTQRQAVSEIISDLSARPALFRDDIAVFLALRAASARLILDPTPRRSPRSSRALGYRARDRGRPGLARPARSARDAAEAPGRARHNAPDAEIEKLMSELQQAIDRFLQQMAQNMQKMDPSELQNLPPVDPSRMVSRNDLQKMLDRARELARTGSKDAARRMLSQLQDMLENLQAGRPGQRRPATARAGR